MNQTDTIVNMRHFLFALLFTCFSAATHAQLLYRISGKGLQRPSYIVGTYHLAPGTFADSIPGAYEALNQCEQVYGELNIADMQQPDSVARVQQAMLLPEGMTLSQLLTPDEMGRVKAYAERQLGPAAAVLMTQAERMTPTTLSTTLEMLTYAMKSGQFNPNESLDLHFQQYALLHGKTTGGLETVSFQTKTLYQGTPLPRQKQLLLCLADNPEFNDMMADRVIDCYFAQDIEGLKEAMDMKLDNDCDNTPDEEASLIDRRNANWVALMPGIMQAHPTFFVVGAAHLPGPSGVLQLLREAGYQVSGSPRGER